MYVYKEDLTLNNYQELTWFKTQPSQTKSITGIFL